MEFVLRSVSGGIYDGRTGREPGSRLNISPFIDMKKFKARVDRVIGHIHCPPAVDEGKVFMPKEMECKDSMKHGRGKDPYY